MLCLRPRRTRFAKLWQLSQQVPVFSAGCDTASSVRFTQGDVSPSLSDCANLDVQPAETAADQNLHLLASEVKAHLVGGDIVNGPSIPFATTGCLCRTRKRCSRISKQNSLTPATSSGYSPCCPAAAICCPQRRQHIDSSEPCIPLKRACLARARDGAGTRCACRVIA